MYCRELFSTIYKCSFGSLGHTRNLHWFHLYLKELTLLLALCIRCLAWSILLPTILGTFLDCTPSFDSIFMENMEKLLSTTRDWCQSDRLVEWSILDLFLLDAWLTHDRRKLSKVLLVSFLRRVHREFWMLYRLRGFVYSSKVVGYRGASNWQSHIYFSILWRPRLIYRVCYDLFHTFVEHLPIVNLWFFMLPILKAHCQRQRSHIIDRILILRLSRSDWYRRKRWSHLGCMVF